MSADALAARVSRPSATSILDMSVYPVAVSMEVYLNNLGHNNVHESYAIPEHYLMSCIIFPDNNRILDTSRLLAAKQKPASR